MTYYHTCINCGTKLDPGERCECDEKPTIIINHHAKLNPCPICGKSAIILHNAKGYMVECMDGHFHNIGVYKTLDESEKYWNACKRIKKIGYIYTRGQQHER